MLLRRPEAPSEAGEGNVRGGQQCSRPLGWTPGLLGLTFPIFRGSLSTFPTRLICLHSGYAPTWLNSLPLIPPTCALSSFEAFANAICRTPAPGFMPFPIPPASLAALYSSFAPHLSHYFLQEGICENILQIQLGASPDSPAPTYPLGLMVHSLVSPAIAGRCCPEAELSLQRVPKKQRRSGVEELSPSGCRTCT